MKCVVQVVKSASLTIDSTPIATIDKGMVVFVGFTHQDSVAIVDSMITKLLALRIFPDAQGKTNLSLQDFSGNLLCVPNFTLYADVSNSRRPAFTNAADPAKAQQLFAYFQQRLLSVWPQATFGVFGADMSVMVHNDGPFTLILERDE